MALERINSSDVAVKSKDRYSSVSNNTLHANYQVVFLYINYTGKRAAHGSTKGPLMRLMTKSNVTGAGMSGVFEY